MPNERTDDAATLPSRNAITRSWRIPALLILSGFIIGAIAAGIPGLVETRHLETELSTALSQRDAAEESLTLAEAEMNKALELASSAQILLRAAQETTESSGAGLVSQTQSDVQPGGFDLSTDAGLCAADAEMTNLELNDAIAPLLGYPADRDDRHFEQDEAIREHKNAAFKRECPARAS